MSTKTLTIRIDEQRAQYLTENFSSVSNGVNEALSVLEMIRLYSTKELEGKFKPEEWCFLIDSLNGTMTDGMFRCNAGALAAHCEDAAQFEKTDEKWDINLYSLTSKIKNLTGAQVDSLYRRVEQFWSDENRNLESFSIF
jgi:hypothetical protein